MRLCERGCSDTNLHHNAELRFIILKKGFQEANNILVADRCEEADLIQSIRDFFFRHLPNLDAFQSIHFVIRFSHHFIDTSKRSFAEGLYHAEIRERHCQRNGDGNCEANGPTAPPTLLFGLYWRSCVRTKECQWQYFRKQKFVCWRRGARGAFGRTKEGRFSATSFLLMIFRAIEDDNLRKQYSVVLHPTNQTSLTEKMIQLRKLVIDCGLPEESEEERKNYSTKCSLRSASDNSLQRSSHFSEELCGKSCLERSS
jgi:hypothetical protein